ncbi:MAG: gamma-glutamyl-gamma-aminobutyrate hydrolase family protein [Sedimentisphaerales bacterium]|nr:gamma-glutamyl-gamma-aminobutyrate hydrolase family protein [Sedimentisphaerales bacterium]
MSDAKPVVNAAVLALCGCLLWTITGCQHAQAPSRPLIGITSVYEPAKPKKSAETTAPFAYAAAVAENGGVPVVLPTIDDEQILQRYLEVLDGLVLIGGDDIPPEAYGEKPHETVVPLEKHRYDFERKLIAKWFAAGKPLLGVCLGMQFANVVAGGTMIQDIPSEVGAKVNHKAYHRVQIQPASSLARLLNSTEASVFSSHHQAVDDLGRNLRVIARSADGVAEAMERTDGKFGLFVQWHPEAMTDLAHRNAIYGALVQACVWSR